MSHGKRALVVLPIVLPILDRIVLYAAIPAGTVIAVLVYGRQCGVIMCIAIGIGIFVAYYLLRNGLLIVLLRLAPLLTLEGELRRIFDRTLIDKDFRGAALDLRSFIEQNGNNRQRAYYLAYYLHQDSDVDQAMWWIEQAREFSDDGDEMILDILEADTLIDLGRLNEAIQILEPMVESPPTYPAAHIAFAKALALVGECERAVQEFQKGLHTLNRPLYRLGINPRVRRFELDTAESIKAKICTHCPDLAPRFQKKD